jgi:hypothetical protein
LTRLMSDVDNEESNEDEEIVESREENMDTKK